MALPDDPQAQIRASGLRFLVTFTSLAAGQFALGETNSRAVVTRAGVGALLTEGTAAALHHAEREAATERPMDLTFLASYGRGELERMYVMLLNAQLHGTNR